MLALTLLRKDLTGTPPTSTTARLIKKQKQWRVGKVLELKVAGALSTK